MDHTFEELKPQILTALQSVNRRISEEPAGLTLVDGFVMQGLQDRTNGIFIGGKSIPLVAVVGNTTGRMYYFALKAILPNLS